MRIIKDYFIYFASLAALAAARYAYTLLLGIKQRPSIPPGSKKRVIIVGASFGGRMIAEGLLDINDSNIEILILDKSGHFEFICANYKTMCDDSFRQLAAPNCEAVKGLNRRGITFPVKFVQGLLQKVDHSTNSIQIQVPGKE